MHICTFPQIQSHACDVMHTHAHTLVLCVHIMHQCFICSDDSCSDRSSIHSDDTDHPMSLATNVSICTDYFSHREQPTRLSEDEVAELEITNSTSITSSETGGLASQTEELNRNCRHQSQPAVPHNSRSFLNSCHGYLNLHPSANNVHMFIKETEI